jgi:hypothetical protein
MTDFKPQNYRIYRRVTATRILTVEDALTVDKVKMTLVEYKRGNGISRQVTHFLDHQIAALLAFDILHHNPAGSAPVWWDGYQEYKGTRKGDELEARTFKAEIVEADNPVKITVSNGPGEPVGSNGAIKPAKGQPQEVVAVLLPWTAARAMALALLMHLQAWQTMTYWPRLTEETWQPDEDRQVDPETGEITTRPRRAIPPHKAEA